MIRARHARKVFDRCRPTAVVAVIGLVVAAAIATSACGDDTDGRIVDHRERQAREAAAEAGLAPEVQDLLGLAARAGSARFSATYTSGRDRVVVAQRPPRRRVDVIVGGAARESYVTDGRRAVRCERAPGDEWRCAADEAEAGEGGATASTIGAFSPELVARTVEALEDGAVGYDLDVHRLTVAGTPTRCLRATPKVDAHGAVEGRLCIAPDGVPLLVDLGDGTPTLRASAYRPTAHADDVRRPDGA